MLVDRPWYEPDLVEVLKKHLNIDFLANSNVKWTYYFEDATKILPTILKPPYDYIHIDADHSGSFAVWYTNSILAIKAAERPLAVSAHDVIQCKCDLEMQVGYRTNEGAVFESWLTYGKEHRVVSAAMYNKCDDKSLYRRLQQTRRKFIGENISQNFLGAEHEDNWKNCETSDTGDYISTSYVYLVPN